MRPPVRTPPPLIETISFFEEESIASNDRLFPKLDHGPPVNRKFQADHQSVAATTQLNVDDVKNQGWQRTGTSSEIQLVSAEVVLEEPEVAEESPPRAQSAPAELHIPAQQVEQSSGFSKVNDTNQPQGISLTPLFPIRDKVTRLGFPFD